MSNLESSYASLISKTAIIAIFTITTIVNRTHNGKDRAFNCQTAQHPQQTIAPPTARLDLDSEQPEDPMPDDSSPLIHHRSSPPSIKAQGIEGWLPIPDTHRFHKSPFSRLLLKFPFLIEIWYWALIYWPYQLFRAWTALYISANHTREAAVKQITTNNALRILHIERKLGLAFEERLQHFISKKCGPWLMALLVRIYLAHIAVGIAFLGYGSRMLGRSWVRCADPTQVLFP